MIQASHLTRRFGDRVAVEDLSLELRPGEILTGVAALVVINAVLMRIAIRVFDRESILTRWK